MSGEITKKDLENMIHEVLAHHFVNGECMIHTRNMQLLKKWTDRNNMPREEFYRGIDANYVELVEKKKNTFIPNYVSINFFKNVEDWFGKGPELFLRAGYEAIGGYFTFTKILPFFIGNSIQDLGDQVTVLNAKFNKTKSFESTHKTESGVCEYVMNVKPITGLSSPKAVMMWNIGIINRMVELSRDKIISSNYSIDENSGHFTYTLKYIPENPSIIDRYFPSLKKKIKDESAKILKEQSDYAQLKQKQVKQYGDSELRSINGGVGSLETKHPNSSYHVRKVCFIATLIGKQLGLNYKDIRTLSIGAVLHDHGKNAIPETILHKEGKFIEDEFLTMKTHPLIGSYSLCDMGYDIEIAKIALQHHESPNGRGYPLGISDEISKFSAIVKIGDMIDGLTEERVYRNPPAFSLEQTKYILEKDADEGNIDKGYTYFILKNTLPVLENLGYSHKIFDMSHSRIDSPKMSKISSDLLGYIKGHNNKFDTDDVYLKNKEFNLENNIIKTHDELAAISELYHTIGISLGKLYSKLSSIESKIMFKRITPPYFLKPEFSYFRDDGIRGI